MDGWNEGWSEPAFPSAEPRHTILHSEPLPHLAGQLDKQELFGSGGKDVGQRWETLRTQNCWFLFQFIHLQKPPEKTALSGVSFFVFFPQAAHTIFVASL